jgi:hypothetical protein
MEAARCITCLTQGEMDAAQLALLCTWANNASAGSGNFRIIESGEFRIIESGDFRIIET